MKLEVNARFLTQRLTGAQRYALEVGARLPSRLGAPLTLLTPDREQMLSLPGELKPCGRLGGHPWEQLELPRARSRERLLFSPCNVGPLAVSRQVLTIHDVFSIQRPQWVSRAFHRWYSFLLPRLARRVAHIITVSDYAKGTIVESLKVAPDKVTVTPLGVDRRFRPAAAADIEGVRERLGLPERFILTLGSLEPRKNLASVLDAWARFPGDSRPPFVIAGGLGNSAVFGAYQPQALPSEGVMLLGYVPDELLPALYSAATLFVYPSFEEGFGLPPLEALACGATVVTSNTSAMREICAPYATLIDPYDAASLAEGMQAALELAEAPELRRRRAHEVAQRFTWERTTEQLAEVLLRYA